MTINDFQSITFGVCFRIDNQIYHYLIPIDNTVREALVEMRNTFTELYDNINAEIENFSPTEKYASTEKLRANLNAEYLHSMNDLFHHQNHPVNNVDLSEYLPVVEYYFAEFVHNNNAKTIGVKRPNQFKALLKKKIFAFVDDTLQAVEDDVFKLDNDFDILIHDTYVEILHPAGFVFISDLEDQILLGVANTIAQLTQSIPFLNFEVIGNYVTNNNARRAAKLLASIKTREDLHLTDQHKVVEKCAHLGIALVEADGRLVVPDDKIVDLLEVLDRRSYEYDLMTNDVVEIYVANSRKKKN
ncbi:Kiwa anti-phage protein KwaB-like domain-containing protein [Parafilimonas sp.]|uniref:Kiwa anti-phage protein KwaB-like domain-containing protein n=1 Tax=Parafilimonas sp. TaxID=1969739 RepID=UPI003F7F0119